MYSRTNQSPALCFHLEGDAYRQVSEWVYTVDHKVIQHRIERLGYARVYPVKDNMIADTRNSRQTEIPQVGTAIPHYGMTQAAFRYMFSPTQDSCAVHVEGNFKGGVVVSRGMSGEDVLRHIQDSFPPEPFTPLDIEVNQGIRIEFQCGDYVDLGRRQYHPLPSYCIRKDIYQVLCQVGWSQDLLTAFTYEFVPSTIGDSITVHNLQTGETINLTKDVDW
jgi:hypothetical protein